MGLLGGEVGLEKHPSFLRRLHYLSEDLTEGCAGVHTLLPRYKCWTLSAQIEDQN